MTNKELQELLSKYPDDLEVINVIDNLVWGKLCDYEVFVSTINKAASKNYENPHANEDKLVISVQS